MVKYIAVGVFCVITGLYVATNEYRFQAIKDNTAIQIEINRNLINEVARQKDLTETQSEAIINLHDRTLRIESYLSSK